MKLGLIARADDRGLSHVTWELARNLRPDRILLVDMHDDRFPTKRWRYDGLATHFEMEWRYEEFNERNPVEQSSNVPHLFFADLDLVFTAETFYGLEDVAAVHGARTVLYVMPEFYRAELPRATETWLPTTWLSQFIPHERVMSWPCPTDRWFKDQTPYRGTHETLRVVMPAGNSAMHDRNGAKVFMRALRDVQEPMDVTVYTQDTAFPVEPRISPSVTYRLQRNAREYWHIARNAHLVVIPRRYGGLCLPAIEALGAGAALAMTDCNPNTLWPIEPLACKPGLTVECPFGDAPTYDVEARDVALLLDEFAADSGLTRARQEESREWAHENSWERRRDKWRAALEEASKR